MFTKYLKYPFDIVEYVGSCNSKFSKWLLCRSLYHVCTSSIYGFWLHLRKCILVYQYSDILNMAA